MNISSPIKSSASPRTTLRACIEAFVLALFVAVALFILGVGPSWAWADEDTAEQSDQVTVSFYANGDLVKSFKVEKGGSLTQEQIESLETPSREPLSLEDYTTTYKLHGHQYIDHYIYDGPFELDFAGWDFGGGDIVHSSVTFRYSLAEYRDLLNTLLRDASFNADTNYGAAWYARQAKLYVGVYHLGEEFISKTGDVKDALKEEFYITSSHDLRLSDCSQYLSQMMSIGRGYPVYGWYRSPFTGVGTSGCMLTKDFLSKQTSADPAQLVRVGGEKLTLCLVFDPTASSSAKPNTSGGDSTDSSSFIDTSLKDIPVVGDSRVTVKGKLADVLDGLAVSVGAKELSSEGPIYETLMKYSLAGAFGLLGMYDITLTAEGEALHTGFGELTLTFTMPLNVNNRFVFVRHLHEAGEHAGEVTTERVKVVDGTVSVTVTDLSPFLIELDTSASDDSSVDLSMTSPKTGQSTSPNATPTVAFIVTVLLGGALLLARTRRVA